VDEIKLSTLSVGHNTCPTTSIQYELYLHLDFARQIKNVAHNGHRMSECSGGFLNWPWCSWALSPSPQWHQGDVAGCYTNMSQLYWTITPSSGLWWERHTNVGSWQLLVSFWQTHRGAGAPSQLLAASAHFRRRCLINTAQHGELPFLQSIPAQLWHCTERASF
jgi:hypothetical protein